MKFMEKLNQFNYQRFIRNRRYFLLAIIMMLTSIIILVFVTLPKVNEIVELQSTLQHEREVLAGLQKKVKGLSEATYLQAFEQSPKVDLALPSQKPLLQLLGSMNQVAQNAGVSLGDIELNPGRISTQSAQQRSGPVVTPPPSGAKEETTVTAQTSAPVAPKNTKVDTLVVKVRAKGTLGQIDKFVDQLERVTPIIDITEINLTRIGLDVSPGEQQYEARLTLSGYYFTQALNVTVDAPLPDLGAPEKEFLDSMKDFIYPELPFQNVIQGGGQDNLFNVNGNSDIEELLKQASASATE